MAYISFQPKDYFNTKLYTGNATTDHAQTGVGFQPDWLWIKERGGTGGHILVDAVRGVSASSTPFVKSNASGAEVSSNTNDFIKSLDSDGFTLGADSYFTDVNKNSSTYVAWNWRAGTGAGSSNTDGSINTVSTSVNTTAGFSISKYTGTGSNATIGHGLGEVPKLIMVKNASIDVDWVVYHSALGATKNLRLNTNEQVDTSSSIWYNTEPTSSVFSIGTATASNGNGNTHVAYCFAEKKGYSKFGQFKGRGNNDGTFVYTGFKPAFVMVRFIDASNGYDFVMYDNKRPRAENPAGNILEANTTDAENTGTAFHCDFSSGGFKFRGTESNVNDGGYDYLYWAFAEEPLVSSNDVPATAR
tara:strand:- start:28 stop:1104 length:1077 start_codon:yes stop_codon:yes gene_type:complete